MSKVNPSSVAPFLCIFPLSDEDLKLLSLGRAHCKIVRKYCIFSGAVRTLATSLRHRTQNDTD